MVIQSVEAVERRGGALRRDKGGNMIENGGGREGVQKDKGEAVW